MVDSIDMAASSNINQIYINWKNLTAQEIIKKEKEGQIAPTEISKWAAEITKLSNIPDDVTYEIAQGETDIDKLNELINPEAVAAAEEENTNSQGENENQYENAATALRQNLSDNGASLKTQANTLADMSLSTENQSEEVIANTAANIISAQALNEEADALTESTISENENNKAEYDRLIARIDSENNPLTNEERNRLNQLGLQLQTAGTQAQQELLNLSSQIEGISSASSSYSNITTNARNFGIEASDVGLQLMGRKEAVNPQDGNAQNNKLDNANDIQNAMGPMNIFKMIFNSNYRTGYRAAEQGASTINTADIADEAISTTDSTLNDFTNNINRHKTEIEQTTMVAGFETNNSSNNDQLDKSEEAAQEQEDLTLAETSMTTDADEIIRRKERKGLT